MQEAVHGVEVALPKSGRRRRMWREGRGMVRISTSGRVHIRARMGYSEV